MTDLTPERPPSRPWAFLVTFACYGARLHGNGRGSVDRTHRTPGSRYLPANARWESYERRMLRESPYRLDGTLRRIVLDALRDTCASAGWMLHAVHVRTNHVHVVVEAEEDHKRVLARLKGRAGYELGKHDPSRKRRWARGGSVRALWSPQSVNAAVDYVVRGQGEPLTVWENPDRWKDVQQ